MTLPAAEILRVFEMVNAKIVFFLYFLEMIPGIIFIIAMTVKTCAVFILAPLPGVRELQIIILMAIKAGEAFMAGMIEFFPRDHPVSAHQPPDSQNNVHYPLRSLRCPGKCRRCLLPCPVRQQLAG
jgi:hypothetical protein